MTLVMRGSIEKNNGEECCPMCKQGDKLPTKEELIELLEKKNKEIKERNGR